VEREAPGEFDYLFDDPADADQASSEDSEDGVWSDEGAPDGFDAFDSRTWYFEPAPTPWYRTPRALTALIAATVAAMALVVSAVLLVLRGPDGGVEETTSVTRTAPTSAPPSRSATQAPPPVLTPPPETSAAPMDPGPAATVRPAPPRATKEPEIGVTRTPVTRSPISVSPRRPGSLG
jgi:hypothetical protein